MEPPPARPSTATRTQWVAHLRSLISETLGSVPFDADEPIRLEYIDRFADEFGSRRVTDRPFLSHVLGLTLEVPKREMALDERLWWAIQSDEFNAGEVSGWIEPHGGLVVGGEALAIEYRTMVELCALHALWLIAGRADSDHLRHRCLDAARWHTRELQPDNAIHRPWGIAAFIALSRSADDEEETKQLASLHAQTLAHNSCLSFGTPDLLSVLIMKDAADQLAGEPSD